MHTLRLTFQTLIVSSYIILFAETVLVLRSRWPAFNKTHDIYLDADMGYIVWYFIMEVLTIRTNYVNLSDNLPLFTDQSFTQRLIASNFDGNW